MIQNCDVLIIGGGPAGSIAAVKLLKAGHSVTLIEKISFPRFVIGESLLPRCNQLLEEAGLLDVIAAAGFKFKGGVAFRNEDNALKIVDFKDNLGQKHNSSFQVRRETFDHLLLKEAEKLGANVIMEAEVTAYDPKENTIEVRNKAQEMTVYRAKKVIDASGYGRVLPRLLNLELPSSLAPRNAIFCRMEHDKRTPDQPEGYIYVYVVGDNDAWIWNIPLSDSVTSVGIVSSDTYFESFSLPLEDFFDHTIRNNTHAKERYAEAQKINTVGYIGGYSSKVKNMFGEKFVMVGNATEFLDPVFSSGVTLALESGSKAADLIIREFQGKRIDWQVEYEDYMMVGVNVFKAYVEAWYDGRLQSILFSKKETVEKIEQKIVSVLSGYVWDEKNMFVHSPEASIDAIYALLKN
ncbi:MAG TPA: NAD(P)/FAD-dependent oxidoreductase [Sulfurovum sp.]|nr:NAD(P)/FAD-dependent oxidoreductase [Sulfurovum sp.]